MKNYNIFLFSLFIVTLFACRPKPLEIDLPPFENQVVVISQVIPDALMTVALTNTIDALEFSESEGDSLNDNLLDQLLVSDAIVTISYRDQKDTLFPVTDGVYTSLFTPSYINENYVLDIKTDDHELRAESEMLPVVRFEEALPVLERIEEDTLVTFNFKIADEPGDNWYMINFYAQTDTITGELDLNSFLNSSNGNVLKKTELLSDLAFDNNQFEGTIDLPSISPSDTMFVTLSNINEDYYDYLQIRQSSTNFFTELTKEPVSLPTNVEGGIGFFNTHFPDVKVYDLKEF